MIGKIVQVAAAAAFVATAVHAYREQKSHGRYYCIPFDFRLPTVDAHSKDSGIRRTLACSLRPYSERAGRSTSTRPDFRWA